MAYKNYEITKDLSKMKLLLSLIFSLVIPICIMAEERSEDELIRLATTQLTECGMVSYDMTKITTKNIDINQTFEDDNIIVYSAKGHGSVIMSKDDTFIPVLGYTNSIISDYSKLPCAMKWWMEEINMQMSSVKAAIYENGARIETHDKAEYSEVSPLVTTKWGQSAPYNASTPVIGGSNAPTGCIATAFAQIINYNQWPKSVAFTGSYSTDGGRTFKDGSVSSVYLFPYKNAYGAYSVDGTTTNIASESYTALEKLNVSRLLRDCGYASEMMYGSNSSGTTSFSLGYGAIQYMAYPEQSVKIALRDLYTDSEWDNLVYNEIRNGYPVVYSGSDPNYGGHAYVVHGIDKNGLVAVNWGWQGVYDGFYAMDAMNADGMTFNSNQSVVYGFHPTALETDHITSQWAGDMYTIKNSADNNSITISTDGIFNYTLNDFKGYVALFVENMKTPEDMIAYSLVTPEDGTVESLYGFSFNDLRIDDIISENLKAGQTYKLYLASSNEPEADSNVYNKVRVLGGQIYYTMTVDANGKPSISSSAFDITNDIREIEVKMPEKTSDKTFNLSGMEVGENHRGIIIRNGRKILNR